MKTLVVKSIQAGLFTLLAISSLVASADTYLIQGATLHTATPKGRLDNADLLLKDGKIIQIGIDLTAGEGVKVVDAKGKHVTPGLMNPMTSIGLVEISAVSGTVDVATENAGMGASFDISPAINFRSTLIPQNRINGLTRALVLPESGNSMFHGTGAAISLRSSNEGLLDAKVAMVASYGNDDASHGGGSRAATYAKLDKALSEARYLRKNAAQYPLGMSYHFSQSIDDLKALYPLLDRKIPLIVNVNRADDIVRMVKLAESHRIKLVINGGKEAWLVADVLAKAKVPVILNPMDNLPGFDSLSVRIDSATLLYKAGVKLLFTGGGTHNAYLLRQVAGNAVAYGLPKQVAVEAMTINPAEVFGIKHYGQLEIGMDADLVVWDGDPLDVISNADAVFIQGEAQPMVSRSTRLADRYWQLKSIQQQAFIK